jgi:hypothetical protein
VLYRKIKKINVKQCEGFILQQNNEGPKALPKNSIRIKWVGGLKRVGALNHLT